jgi:hypothetical protein
MPRLALFRKILPFTSPTSTDRSRPCASTATAAPIAGGMPRLRAK